MSLSLSAKDLESLFLGVLDNYFRESLSVRHLQKTAFKPRKIGTLSKTDNAKIQTYDTFEKKCATPLRLYKVNNTYYYRRKIKKQLFRISLKTQNLKTAIYRKKLFDLIDKEEFLKMFTLQKGDYKYIFEYDSPEEFQLLLKEITETHKQLEQLPHRALIVHNELDTIEKVKSTKEIDFAELELKFLAHKRKMDKVSSSTYKAYASTFKKLKEFFRNTYIYAIDIEDYEEFRDYLREEYDLKNKTINNHMAYVNMFLTFGVTYKLIPENNVEGLENFKEDAVEKENYTDEDITNILAYDYEHNYKNIFTIAAYTGMRVSEIVNLTKESVKKDSKTGTYYFDILKSKTKAGIRKVPIHKDILDDVLDRMNFPLLEDKSGNAAQKAILRQLYKVIPKESTKTFHTFRGTFLRKCISNFPKEDYLSLIQEIVGHSKSNSASLTVDTYAKGFELALKKEIVDSVSYH